MNKFAQTRFVLQCVTAIFVKVSLSRVSGGGNGCINKVDAAAALQ
jgi:hypothetical protein